MAVFGLQSSQPFHVPFTTVNKSVWAKFCTMNRFRPKHSELLCLQQLSYAEMLKINGIPLLTAWRGLRQEYDEVDAQFGGTNHHLWATKIMKCILNANHVLGYVWIAICTEMPFCWTLNEQFEVWNQHYANKPQQELISIIRPARRTGLEMLFWLNKPQSSVLFMNFHLTPSHICLSFFFFTTWTLFAFRLEVTNS